MISIVTVSYNSENTIRQTIESVIHQSYEGNIEYIFIDGASTDRTVDIIKEYIDIDGTCIENRNVKMILISESDTGIYNAMNKGIAVAQGDVVGILNSDDWYEKDAIKQVMEIFDNSDAQIVHGSRNVYDSSGFLYRQVPKPLEQMWKDMVIYHPTVFVKMDIYVKYGRYDESYRISADYDKMMEFYLCGLRIVECKAVLTNFRRDGISGTDLRGVLYENNSMILKYIQKASNKKEVLKYRINAVESYLTRIALQNNDISLCNYIKNVTMDIKHMKIWGTGIWGNRIATYFENNGINVSAYYDSNDKKIGQLFHSKTIESVNQIDDVNSIIICCIRDFKRKIDRNKHNIVFLDDIISELFTWNNADDDLVRQIVAMKEIVGNIKR